MGNMTPTSATTLVFTQPTAINGVVPVCAGTYSISPYYPTLYLLTAHVGVSSMNVPDGSLLSVKVNTTAGTILSGYITVTAQTGTVLLSSFCTPSTLLQNVTISDSLGNVISTGQ